MVWRTKRSAGGCKKEFYSLERTATFLASCSQRTSRTLDRFTTTRASQDSWVFLCLLLPLAPAPIQAAASWSGMARAGVKPTGMSSVGRLMHSVGRLRSVVTRQPGSERGPATCGPIRCVCDATTGATWRRPLSSTTSFLTDWARRCARAISTPLPEPKFSSGTRPIGRACARRTMTARPRPRTAASATRADQVGRRLENDPKGCVSPHAPGRCALPDRRGEGEVGKSDP